MRVRRLVSVGVAVAVATLAFPLTTAEAYCASPNLKWNSTTLSISGDSNVPSSWATSLANASAQWNNVAGANWSIAWKGISFIGPVMAKVHYTAFPPTPYNGAPGVTDLKYANGIITGGDIYLNAAYTWNTAGTMNQANMQADVRTVFLHELGHEVYLNHPSQCGAMTSAEVASVMNPNWVKKWTTTADDKAGLAARK